MIAHLLRRLLCKIGIHKFGRGEGPDPDNQTRRCSIGYCMRGFPCPVYLVNGKRRRIPDQVQVERLARFSR